MPCSSSNLDSSWAHPELVLAVTYIPAVTLRFCEDDVKMTDVNSVVMCNRVTWHVKWGLHWGHTSLVSALHSRHPEISSR
jgi:hypothetical protein